MKRYEFTFGVWVDAENEQDAFAKLQPIVVALNEIDAEGDSSLELEGVTEVPS